MSCQCSQNTYDYGVKRKDDKDDKDDKDEKRKDDKVLNSHVDRCGDCCLIHQQFTLTENISVIGSTPIKIYRAPDDLFNNESPFGTVIVSNCGCTSLTVVFRTEDNGGGTNTNGIIVPPKGQFAITGAIEEIDVAPTNPDPNRPVPICALFTFDLFLLLPDCSNRAVPGIAPASASSVG